MKQTLEKVVQIAAASAVTLGVAAAGYLALSQPSSSTSKSMPANPVVQSSDTNYTITQWEKKALQGPGESFQGPYEMMSGIISQSGVYDSISQKAKRIGFNPEILARGEKQWLNEEMWRILKIDNNMPNDSISPGGLYNIPTADGARELVEQYVRDKETIGFTIEDKGWNLDRIVKDVYSVDPNSSTGKIIKNAILRENERIMGGNPNYVQIGREYRLPNPLSDKYSDSLYITNPAKKPQTKMRTPREAGVNPQYARNMALPAQHRAQYRV